MASVLKLDTIKSLAGNEAATINEAGVTSFNNPIIQTLPILSVSFTTQTVTNSTITKLVNETIAVDNYSWWDAVNHRWTPQIAGWYEIYLYVDGAGTTNATLLYSRIYINGNPFIFGINRTSNLINLGTSISALCQFNGATDYLEAYTQLYGSGTLTSSGYMSAKLLQRN